jgi:hypothetical protein
LRSIAGDRNAPQKHAWRAKIILATAEGWGTTEIMRVFVVETNADPKPFVWTADSRRVLAAVKRGKQAPLADARAEAANAQADLPSTEAFISHLKLEIEELRRQRYGTRLLDRMERQLEELEVTARRGAPCARSAVDG